MLTSEGVSGRVREPLEAGAGRRGGRPAPAPEPGPVVTQIVERVTVLQRDGRHELTFRLDPPELGGVRIEAVLEGRHLEIRISTEHEPTRALLEQGVSRLREALAEQGIVAGRVSVELGFDSAARQFAGGGRQPEERGVPAPPARATNAVAPRRLAGSAQGRVDLWV